jgi:uncharacterized protein YdaU (DUF1376 family)
MSKDSKPDAWMPLYIGDWEADTGHLDCEQDGAYSRLVRWYWRNGPPADDDAMIARILRMDLKRWRKLRPIIAAFFKVVDGRWVHKRVEEELVRWEEKRRRAIERAAAGGRAKAAKSTASSSATSTPKALLEQCTSASSTEVDGPSEPSTLSRRERPEARHEGASDRRADPDDERVWLLEAAEAEAEEFRCRRSDPDRASELAEFIAFAKDQAARLRRARLSIVGSAA